jgi:FkbM family methyltransferase
MNIREWYKTDGYKIKDPKEKLAELHKRLIFIGNINNEIPEQLLSLKYIKPDDIVLELGSNYGRNTSVIATILNDDRNLVTLECGIEEVEILRMNRDNNYFNYNIEPCALSKRNLIRKGWNTEYSETVKEGYKSVDIISWNELNNKYKLQFNTLVCDCEGALYYILLDEPNLLNQFHTIILENDFNNLQHEIDTIHMILEKGFNITYRKELLSDGWDKYYFYIVFQK